MPDEPTNPAWRAGPDPISVGVAGRSRHLDLDAMSAAIDGALSPADAAAARAHVASCPDCDRDLAELSATVDILRNLPQYEPRRSFALGPEHARGKQAGVARRAAPVAPGSRGRSTLPASRPVPGATDEERGWGSRLLPSIRVLRYATSLVAVLLLLATAGDLLSPDPVPLAAPQGFVAAPAAQDAAPAEVAAPAPEVAAPAAPTTAGSLRAVDANDVTGDGTNAAVGASQAAGGERAARPAPAPVSPWRVAQLALGLVLLWLTVSLVGRLLIDRHERMPG